ncbi:MAG: thioesterase family protein [Burkholderiaceae bacterium]
MSNAVPDTGGQQGSVVHEIEIPIRWGDMDAMGHVNNAVYFRYLEQLRISWFDALGLGQQGDPQGPVIVNAHCSFLRELRYPGVVQARLSVGTIGRTSFETLATLSRSDDPDTVYAEGGAKVVWVDRAQRKSVPVPEAIRAAGAGGGSKPA